MHLEKLKSLSTIRKPPTDFLTDMTDKTSSLMRTRKFEQDERYKGVKKRNIHLLGKFVEIQQGR